jgi:hypothetical protein
MNDDERQARIDAIKARTSSRVNPCTVNLTDARWLLSELEAAQAREQALREALEPYSAHRLALETTSLANQVRATVAIDSMD